MESTKLVLPKDPRDLLNLYDAASKVRLYETLRHEISDYVEEYIINQIVDKKEVLSTLGELASEWKFVNKKQKQYKVTAANLDTHVNESSPKDKKHTRCFVLAPSTKQVYGIDDLFIFDGEEYHFMESCFGYNQ